MSDADAPTVAVPVRSARGDVAVLIAVAFGAAIAVALGVFGKVHDPQYFSVSIAGFSSGLAVKSWLATVAIALAVFQLVSAFAMYRLIPGGKAPSWIGTAHVWSGRLAVLVSVPVAGDRPDSLRFESFNTPLLFHFPFR